MNSHKLEEGWLAGAYHVSVVNPVVCVHCRAPLTPAPAYALGAPYHALIHKHCLPHFAYMGTYPHDLPVVAYARSTTTIRPMGRSQDDNGFVAIRDN